MNTSIIEVFPDEPPSARARYWERQAENQEITIQLLITALDKLARLGNEPLLGNSRGNEIAIKALQDVGSLPKEPA